MANELTFGEGISLPVVERKGKGALLKGGGLFGLLGFGTGWAVTQVITSKTIPNDPNKNIYDVTGGLVLGAAMFALAAAGVLQAHPVRWKI